MGFLTFFFLFFDDDVNICFVLSPRGINTFHGQRVCSDSFFEGCQHCSSKAPSPKAARQGLSHDCLDELPSFGWSACVTDVFFSHGPQATVARAMSEGTCWPLCREKPGLNSYFCSVEVVWVLLRVFLEAWKLCKSNNYPLLFEALDKKALHEVAHPFCGVCFNQQHIPLPPGIGIRCRRWGQGSSRHAPQLAPYSCLLTAWLSWQPPESLPTLVLLKSKQTLAVQWWRSFLVLIMSIEIFLILPVCLTAWMS